MTNLLGRRILIVEDEMMIALMLQDILEELGCIVVGVAGSAVEAFRLIDANQGRLDAATLDINLGGIFSLDIAGELDAHGIPFIVTTGYINAPHLIDLKDRLRVQKPYGSGDIKRALQCLNWREANDG